MSSLQDAPTFRVVLKFCLGWKGFPNGRIECFTLHLTCFAKFLRQSLKYKTWYKAVSTIDRKTYMASQATKTLQKATSIESFKDEIIDAKINTNIYRRSTNQNILLK